ncbi:TetR/AcrR family transcriptional regulator [Aquibacillus kalidii]|uniref:TetR/AcrR family transcriptional regulator n=1 Tax=Aquibacillus kalidii TaxID=2762597 RepID=UPI001C991D4D|nr:TetR/AcrR family transcriptional regulator [Aquibacillus kalidii]
MNSKKNRSLGRPRTSDLKQPTNQIILQAATELFLSHGYQDVSIDEVAKKCGVTKATVYYYYESKALLFTETMVQLMFRIREQMLDMLSEKQPLRTRLLNVTVAHLKATVDLDLDGFMRETKSSLSEEQIKQVQQAERKMYDTIEKAFSNAMEVGEIPHVNPTFASHSYIALLRVGNYRNANNEPLFPTVQETAENINTFFWNGIFPNHD